MKKILSSFIVGILALGISVVAHAQSVPVEEVGRFNRFIWAEGIEANYGGEILTEPIDTSEFETLIISISEENSQPYKLYVHVQSRFFEDEEFKLTVNSTGDNKLVSTYQFIQVTHNNSRISVPVNGVETRLRIFVNSRTPVTLNINGALIRGMPLVGGGDDNDQCKEDILDLQDEMSMLRQQLAEANLYLDQLKWKELKRQEKIEKRKQKRLERKDKKKHKDHDDDD